MRIFLLVLLGAVACTGTQTDQVEPTIDAPDPRTWLEPPAPPEPRPPLSKGLAHRLAILHFAWTQARAHRAVRPRLDWLPDERWIVFPNRAGCRLFGCGPCTAVAAIEPVYCGSAHPLPMRVHGCGIDMTTHYRMTESGFAIVEPEDEPEIPAP